MVRGRPVQQVQRMSSGTTPSFRLARPLDFARDHVRGGGAGRATTFVVLYGDYLCPYCRRLAPVLARLRQTFGERLAYAYRHFPNETAHPGASFMSRAAEAAGRQGRFWEMHDALFAHEPPLTEEAVRSFALEIGLDMESFERDLGDDELTRRVEADVADGRRNGVTGTPTIFVDNQRYDGAWDFYSMLEGIERPVAARVQRSARVFANLPASGGFMLLLAALLAILAANSPLAPLYRSLVDAAYSIGPSGASMSQTVAEWFSEGLLSFFFLLVGLEIRREMTAGSLSEVRAAILPVIAAVGGVVVPALVYLAINQGPAWRGWAVPTATDVAFAIGILALLGDRVPPALKVFVAALAVIDDVLSVLTLAVFYSHGLDLAWLAASGVAVAGLLALNRWRVYAAWPYALVTLVVWISLHGAGIHAALAGILLAALLPTRPKPEAGPLLAQAATALAALENAEAEIAASGETKRRIDQEPVWDWASRQLSAASERLLSPADRIERAVAPWSTYVILPLFAFAATGVSFAVDLSEPDARQIVLGVSLGLVFGKPIGIALASFLAVKSGLALAPAGVGLRAFAGAAVLCGVGDTVALLMADQAFPVQAEGEIAKIGVLVGSAVSAALGALLFVLGRQATAGASAPAVSRPGDGSSQ